MHPFDQFALSVTILALYKCALMTYRMRGVYWKKLGVGASAMKFGKAWFQSLAGSDGDISAMLAVMTAADSASYSGGADGDSAGGGDSSGAG
jgi:hypothetical protein